MSKCRGISRLGHQRVRVLIRMLHVYILSPRLACPACFSSPALPHLLSFALLPPLFFFPFICEGQGPCLVPGRPGGRCCCDGCPGEALPP